MSSLTTLFTKKSRGFGTDRTSGSGSVATGLVSEVDAFWLQLDAVITEDHTHTTAVTSNPVQSGAQIANNAINLPIELSITGVVTDTPNFLQAGNWGGSVKGIEGLLSGAPSGEGVTGTRSQQAFQGLVTLKNSQTLITVDTGLATYTNMLLTNVSTTTDSTTENGLKVKLDFKEIIRPSSDISGENKGNQTLIPPSETDLLGISSVIGSIVTSQRLNF